jgi:hypothetical protein
MIVWFNCHVCVLKDLNAACRQMQTRVVELIQKVQNDEVVGKFNLDEDA